MGDQGWNPSSHICTKGMGYPALEENVVDILFWVVTGSTMGQYLKPFPVQANIGGGSLMAHDPQEGLHHLIGDINSPDYFESLITSLVTLTIFLSSNMLIRRGCSELTTLGMIPCPFILARRRSGKK